MLVEARKGGTTTVNAACRVMRQVLEFDDGSYWCWRLTLSDASVTVTAFNTPDCPLSSIEDGTPVYVALTGRPGAASDALDLTELSPMNRDEVALYGSQLLPASLCPLQARHSLRCVQTLVAGMQTVVGEFANRVLADERIYPGLLQVAGSWEHHHAYPGGLLVHSASVALRCLRAAEGFGPEKSDAIVAAGLFHDLGKIRTARGKGQGQLRHFLPHEPLTAELLAEHLCWLEDRAPRSAAYVRSSLYGYMGPARGFAAFVGADIVRAADQVDAAVDRGKDEIHLYAG